MAWGQLVQLGDKASLFLIAKLWQTAEEQGQCSLRCGGITFLLEGGIL